MELHQLLQCKGLEIKQKEWSPQLMDGDQQNNSRQKNFRVKEGPTTTQTRV